MPQEPEVPTWIMTLIALTFFGGLLAVYVVITRRRRAGFERLAGRYGLNFLEDAAAEVTLPPEFLKEIESGIVVNSRVGRALIGRLDGASVALCEVLKYRARQHGGERGHYSLTVVAIEAADREFPAFSLQPEGLRHKLVDLRDNVDIDFHDSPKFSRKYYLEADDRRAVRDLFNEPVRSFFERNSGRCVRCYGLQMVYYRPVRLLGWSAFRPKLAKKLLDEAVDVYRLLKSAAGP